jgi:hypothetical protein
MRRLLLPVLGVVLGLVASEIALRLLGIGYTGLVQPDRYTGWALRPRAVGWESGRSRSQFVAINSAGLRDVEHSRTKPSDGWRLAVLGDSFTQGKEVELEDTYPRLLEKRLHGCEALHDRGVEVINFGVKGYGTAQELLTLQHRVWDYDVDAVLLGFYVGNDLADNEPSLASDKVMRPYFRYAADGRLTPDFGFREQQWYRDAQTKIGHLRTALKERIRLWQVLSRIVLVERAAKQGGQDDLDPFLRGALAPPRDAAWAEAWKLSEDLLRAARDEAAAHRRPFFFFTIGSAIQVDPDPSRREAYAKQLGVTDLLYPERRLAELARAAAIPFFPLIEPMQRDAERQHVYLHGFSDTGFGRGHWNERGHELAAELLGDGICAALREPGAKRDER